MAFDLGWRPSLSRYNRLGDGRVFRGSTTHVQGWWRVELLLRSCPTCARRSASDNKSIGCTRLCWNYKRNFYAARRNCLFQRWKRATNCKMWLLKCDFNEDFSVWKCTCREAARTSQGQHHLAMCVVKWYNISNEMCQFLRCCHLQAAAAAATLMCVNYQCPMSVIDRADMIECMRLVSNMLRGVEWSGPCSAIRSLLNQLQSACMLMSHGVCIRQGPVTGG